MIEIASRTTERYAFAFLYAFFYVCSGILLLCSVSSASVLSYLTVSYVILVFVYALEILYSFFFFFASFGRLFRSHFGNNMLHTRICTHTVGHECGGSWNFYSRTRHREKMSVGVFVLVCMQAFGYGEGADRFFFLPFFFLMDAGTLLGCSMHTFHEIFMWRSNVTDSKDNNLLLERTEANHIISLPTARVLGRLCKDEWVICRRRFSFYVNFER